MGFTDFILTPRGSEGFFHMKVNKLSCQMCRKLQGIRTIIIIIMIIIIIIIIIIIVIIIIIIIINIIIIIVVVVVIIIIGLSMFSDGYYSINML